MQNADYTGPATREGAHYTLKALGIVIERRMDLVNREAANPEDPFELGLAQGRWQELVWMADLINKQP